MENLLYRKNVVGENNSQSNSTQDGDRIINEVQVLNSNDETQTVCDKLNQFKLNQ